MLQPDLEQLERAATRQLLAETPKTDGRPAKLKPKLKVTVMCTTELENLPVRNVEPVIEGLLMPHQLALLGGKPKVGKSIFALEMCNAIARGEPFLGRFGVRQGKVIYWMADDPNEHRFRERLETLGGLSDQIYVSWAREPLTPPILAEFKGLIEEHRPVLFVVDCYQAIRLQRGANSDFVAREYNEIRMLTDLAEQAGPAIVLIVHASKGVSKDAFDVIAGSYGVGAAASTRIVYERYQTGRPERLVRADGRDVEAIEFMAYMDRTKRVRFGTQGQAAHHWPTLYKLAARPDKSVWTPKDLEEEIGCQRRWATYLLNELSEAGAVERIGHGRYLVADEMTRIAREVKTCLK